MRITTLILMTLALVPAGLTAQDPEQQQSAEARIQATLEAAAESRIPLSLLESKLEEGRAKGVAEARVAAALEARLGALVRARRTMEQGMEPGEMEAVSAGELSVAADALEAGVSESALLSLQTSSSGESRAVAIAVLSSLVRLGEASGTALARVQAALGGGPGALAELRAETSALLRARGLVPPVNLDAVLGVGGGLGGG